MVVVIAFFSLLQPFGYSGCYNHTWSGTIGNCNDSKLQVTTTVLAYYDDNGYMIMIVVVLRLLFSSTYMVSIDVMVIPFNLEKIIDFYFLGYRIVDFFPQCQTVS